MPTYAAAFTARRSGNGHIGSLVRQLDELLYASFVASYILDANFLNFIIRCVCMCCVNAAAAECYYRLCPQRTDIQAFGSSAQLQFSSPKEHHPDRSLKFHITAAAVINFLNIIYHIGVPLAWDPRGIVIDFVGQGRATTLFAETGLKKALTPPSSTRSIPSVYLSAIYLRLGHRFLAALPHHRHIRDRSLWQRSRFG